MSNSVAIIGLNGRFPQANNIAEFWDNLRLGRECITFFSEAELVAQGTPADLLKRPNYVCAGAPLEGINLFDASFFNYSPAEATLLDPQQRIFLECVAEALEVSGYARPPADLRVGVFASVAASKYALDYVLRAPALAGAVDPLEIQIGNDKDFLASRVSYKLNLRGPSITIQTACSSSLVAVHLACQSILSGECGLALAGGVSLMNLSKTGYLYHHGGISSEDGHCRAYDAMTTGSVSGDGVGVVVLKDLKAALADRDMIYAIIKGSAVNNDGAEKLGYTAPSIEGQEQVIAEAMAIANVPADTITYVEGHGSGTPLGDLVEVRALTRAFRQQTSKVQFCGLGSVKTNIGHLNTAAGVVGLIKVVLAMDHNLMPPSLHFQAAPSEMNLEQSPFFVNTTVREWKNDGRPLRAGVSSFGLGGTNAHLVVESYSRNKRRRSKGSPKKEQWPHHHVLILSAKSKSALEKTERNLQQFVNRNAPGLFDLEYSLATGRHAHDFKRVIICSQPDQVFSALDGSDPENTLSGISRGEASASFLFSGLGDQYYGMAGPLYFAEPIFRNTVDQCLDILRPLVDVDFRSLLLSNRASQTGGSIDLRQMLSRPDAENRFSDQCEAHPALFVLELALAKLWMHWGVRPDCMLGYSLGEYVAACIAGVFSVADALSLISRRAQLLRSIPAGGMLTVSLPEERLEQFLSEEIDISAKLGPDTFVLSGTREAITRVERMMQDHGIACRQLTTKLPFHSRFLASLKKPLQELLSGITLKPPQIPYLSNTSGTWVTSEEATNRLYWAEHLSNPVRFFDNLSELFKVDRRLLVELGPGSSLSSIAAQHPSKGPNHVIVNSLPHAGDPRSPERIIYTSLAKLWLMGVPVHWHAFHSSRPGKRIPIPTYPFERQNYWAIPPSEPKSDHPTLVSKPLPPQSHIYSPVWTRLEPTGINRSKKRRRSLVFMIEGRIGDAVVKELGATEEALRVFPAETYKRTDQSSFQLNPSHEADFGRLFDSLKRENALPEQIVYLWPLLSLRANPLDDLDNLNCCFQCLLFMARTLSRSGLSHPVHLHIVSRGIFDVTGLERIAPEQSLVIGPAKVIPQEYSNVSCSHIDLESPDTCEGGLQCFLRMLQCDGFARVAVRGCYAWQQSFAPSDCALQEDLPKLLRQGGNYIITGGLGGMGLEIARYLAPRIKPNLVLVTRRRFPHREEGKRALSQRQGASLDSARIMKVLKDLETLGARILVESADVGSYEQMTMAVAKAEASFGAINGVFHLAGVPGGGLIHERSEAAIRGVLQSKVAGTRVLERLFSARSIDFMLLCSSLTGTAGAIGQVDYCAANAFLDCFASYFTATHKCRAVSIAWDRWKDIGMGPSMAVRKHIQGEAAADLTADEATKLLEQALDSRGPSNFLITRRDIQSALSPVRASALLEDLAKARAPEEAGSLKARPELMCSYVAPQNDTEVRIVHIWQKILGIESPGALDNFFDLGGNSLLGIRLLAELNREFGITLSIPAIYEAPTPRGLASIIAGRDSDTKELQDSVQRAKWRIQRIQDRLGASV